MLEEILDRENMRNAFAQVTGNKGAAGVDGMKTTELLGYLTLHWQVWRSEILESRYVPSAVKKVEIPKPQGGMRMLGIPTVKDRLLQQAIAQWLSRRCEPEFSEHSYGFRPGRNAHQAVKQAQTYLNEGYEWVVELDLEKFFDRVNHDKLMGLVAKKVTDKRTLRLIRSYLNSGIMENGVKIPRTEGTPQGSPLSPLLSNIILNELDKELEERGHRYVRYADDCSIYVKSAKAAERVMETISDYIEKQLKLKVNRTKSKVSMPSESTLLGLTFSRNEKGWQIRIAPKSMERMRKKIKAHTERKDPRSAKDKISKFSSVLKGWVNYFAIAKAEGWMKELDKLLRTRLRMGIWKQWKLPRTRIRELLRQGIHTDWAHRWGYSRKGPCRLAHSQVLCQALPNKYFESIGLVGFTAYYTQRTALQRK